MPESKGVGLEAVDAHWAVRAIAPRDRARAFVIADDLWASMTSRSESVASHGDTPARAIGSRTARKKNPRAAVRSADATHDDGDSDIDDDTLIGQVATAYERATIDRAVALNVEAGADATAAARLKDDVEAAARQAFLLERVLPFPVPVDPFGAYRVLKMASLATVGASGHLLDEWLVLHQDAIARQLDVARRVRTSAATSIADLDGRWDVSLRWQLVDAWLDLLHVPAKVEQAFNTLGALREARDGREFAFLASLPLAGAQAMRLHLFALYCVADSAATLTLHCRRGPFRDTEERLARTFGRARDAAAGDLALDDAIQWLALAASHAAEQQTSQIELPGLIG